MRARTALASAALVALAPAGAAGQPSPPPPPPFRAAAELTVDVDGDGRADRLRLEAPGALVLERASGQRQLVPFAISGSPGEGRLTAAAAPGGALVAATARLGDAWEGVGLRWDGTRLRELWRGPLGPVDDDAYALWLEARPEGLVRFQARADLVRCDGQPLALFEERWDERAAAFRPAPQVVRVPDSLPKATVTAVTGGPAPGWYRPAIASRQDGAADAGALVAPRALADGDLATAWRASPAEGAAVTFRTSLRGGKAIAVRVVPGGATAAAARDHLRPARLAILGAGGGALVELPDAGGRAPAQAYRAALPTPLDGCVTVVVLAVHKAGAPAGAVLAIPELAVLADVEEAPGGLEAALTTTVAAGGLAGESAARALAERGLPAVQALTARLATASAVERGRLFAALAAVEHPAVLPVVADALAAGELATSDVEPRLDRLLALEPAPPAEGALTALARTGARDGRAISDETRAALGRALARRWRPADGLAAGPGAALLAAAGEGGAALRAERATLLAAAGAPALVAAVTAGADRPAAWQADVWRAAGKAAVAAPVEVREATATAMLTALEAADDHERRYRLVVALTPLAGPDGLDRLRRWLDAHAATASDRALRRLVADGLTRNPQADARLWAIELVADADPGTRLAAIRGLTTADEPTDLPRPRPPVTADHELVRDGGDRALVSALGGDRWPELRREAAAALGLRCGRPGPRAALETALTAESDVRVRIEALAALVTCRAPDIELRLLTVADDVRAPADLRDRALGLYGTLPGDVLLLLPRFERLRSRAFSDDTSLALAARAATALGAIGDPRASGALLAAARDGTFPELTAAAATALGALGRGCPAEARAVLERLLGHDDRRVALAARGALQRCGAR